MYCVGLTGTIASGKTTALNYFSKLGVATLSADIIAREITQTNPAVIKAIHHYFGSCVFLPSGELNRRALRTLIFSDPIKRQWLEKLLHPLIQQNIQEAIQQVMTPYCVIEIPLLLNRSHFPYLNRVLLITTDQATLLTRIMARDQCSEEDAQAILNVQPIDASRQHIADDIVVNNEDPKALKHAIHQLDKHYRTLFKTAR